MKTLVLAVAILACIGTFESANGAISGIEILSANGSYIPGISPLIV